MTAPPLGPAGPRVVVIGAGIAGLAAAARVRTGRPDTEVLIYDAAPAIGGKLASAEVGGVRVDVGAEAMLNRRPEAVDLARAAGLAEDLVHPLTTSAMLWNRDRMVRMPRTLMGVPGDPHDLAAIVSKAGLVRAGLEPRLPPTDLTDRDVSVGRLVEERLGREVVDRLVEPLLGGVYAGNARELSVRATVPQLVSLLETDRSLTQAAARALAAPASDAPVFAGIRGGLSRLPEAICAHWSLRPEVGATVRDLARRPDGGWHLVVGDTTAPQIVSADAVIVATPARAAARLLSDVAPVAALELARIEYASMAIVTLAFRAADFPSFAGSGFLVPPVDGHRIKAATFSHLKWNWVAQAGQREGIVVLRCSLGRHREELTLQVDDEELVRLATLDLASAIGLTSAHVDAHVQRWGGALPQYAVGHLGRIATIRDDVAQQPGLAVCGAAYDGLGLPACVSSADRAAAQVLEHLGTMPV